eukprot:jgi/Chlat1/5704/Chrsp38S05544
MGGVASPQGGFRATTAAGAHRLRQHWRTPLQRRRRLLLFLLLLVGVLLTPSDGVLCSARAEPDESEEAHYSSSATADGEQVLTQVPDQGDAAALHTHHHHDHDEDQAYVHAQQIHHDMAERSSQDGASAPPRRYVAHLDDYGYDHTHSHYDDYAREDAAVYHDARLLPGDFGSVEGGVDAEVLDLTVDAAYDRAYEAEAQHYSDEDDVDHAAFQEAEDQLYDIEEKLYANATMRDIAWAVQELKAFAEGEDAALRMEASTRGQALFLLAVLSATGYAGELHPRDEQAAVAYLHAAAEAGCSEARMAIASRLLEGRGYALDDANCTLALPHMKAAALEALEAAEADGFFHLPDTPVLLRERLRDAGYDARVAPELLQVREEEELEAGVAAGGDAAAVARRHLGYRRLVGGRGVPRDAEVARNEFEAAAAAGDELAAFNLGYLHMQGVGIEGGSNYTAAKRWFEEAARAGVPAAHNGLGVLHFNGWGVDRNVTRAKEFFEAGAADDDPDALFNLGTVYAAGHGTPHDDGAAVALYTRATDAGHYRAPYVLAGMHALGQGVPRPDCKRAVELYRVVVEERGSWGPDMEDAVAALDAGDSWGALLRYALVAEQGSPDAAANMAYVLRYAPPPLPRAAAWLPTGAGDRYVLALEAAEMAASRDAKEWLIEAGNLHYKGLGAVPINTTRAAELYAAAANQSLAEGMFSLAWCCQHGQGVAKDMRRARGLYLDAIATNSQELLPSALALVWLHAQWAFEIAFASHAAASMGDAAVLIVLTLALAIVLARLLRHPPEEQHQQGFSHVSHSMLAQLTYKPQRDKLN